MSKFKVGDRVKVVACIHVAAGCRPWLSAIGKCGVVTGPGEYGFDWEVSLDNGEIGDVMSDEIRPLTNPKDEQAADAFIKQLERLGREPLISVHAKEKA